MAKNLIPQIAQMLGVAIGEEFKIKSVDGWTYKFEEDGLKATRDNEEFTADIEIADLLIGKKEIIKLPWRPKKGEGYWTFNVFFGSGKWAVASFVWGDEVFDKAVLKAGWVYRTKEEAKAALPAVAKEMGVEYEI